jgi:hypothetical protein
MHQGRAQRFDAPSHLDELAIMPAFFQNLPCAMILRNMSPCAKTVTQCTIGGGSGQEFGIVVQL